MWVAFLPQHHLVDPTTSQFYLQLTGQHSNSLPSHEKIYQGVMPGISFSILDQENMPEFSSFHKKAIFFKPQFQI